MRLNSVEKESTIRLGCVDGEQTIKGGSVMAEGRITGYVSVPKGYDSYQGEYNVVPDIVEQELQTANKLMNNNVVIAKIPLWEVSNDANGETVIIGKEII